MLMLAYSGHLELALARSTAPWMQWGTVLNVRCSSVSSALLGFFDRMRMPGRAFSWWRAGGGHAVGADDRAVQVEVGVPGHRRTLRRGGLVGCVVSGHGQPLVRVAVRGRGLYAVVPGRWCASCRARCDALLQGVADVAAPGRGGRRRGPPGSGCSPRGSVMCSPWWRMGCLALTSGPRPPGCRHGEGPRHAVGGGGASRRNCPGIAPLCATDACAGRLPLPSTVRGHRRGVPRKHGGVRAA